MLEKIGSTILKHNKFFNLGLSLSLAYGAERLIQVACSTEYNHSAIGFPMFMVGAAFAAATVVNTITTFSNNSISLNLGVKTLKAYFSHFSHKILSPEGLSADEKKTHKIASTFLNTLFYYSTMQPNGKAFAARYNTDLNKSDYVQYQTKFTFLLGQLKGTNLVAKCFCLALRGDYFSCSQFASLFSLQNNTFTAKEIKYIDNFFKKDLKLDHELLSNQELGKLIFKQLSLNTQKQLLEKLDLDDINHTYHNELVKIYQNKKNEKNSNTKDNDAKLFHMNLDSVNQQLKHQKIEVLPSVNTLHNSEFQMFTEQFHLLFPESSDVIHAIEAIHDAKEKMSALLKNFNTNINPNYVEAQLFLDNDVQKVIDSFMKETFLLSQMQINQHPKMNEKKEMILDSMTQRLTLIENRMNHINDMVNNTMESELDNVMLVNKKVLEAKM